MIEKCQLSKLMAALIDQPILGSVFIADFFLLFFLKTQHWTFTAVMLGGLVGMSMYYGQKLALFQCQTCEPEAEQAEAAGQTEQKD
jgi:hypothetical protein